MFLYPEKAAFGRTVPKNMIYANARPSSRVKSLFVSEVEEMVWAYKLAPKTINLPAKGGYNEIEVFNVTLRSKELSLDVLKAIDRAIPYPVFYNLHKGKKVQFVAAHKRPAQDSTDKWVLGSYYQSEWQKKSDAEKPLPVALNLKNLYEQMITAHMNLPVRKEESFATFIERDLQIKKSERELTKLQSRLKKEKQFNRKVEINAEIRKVSKRLKALTAV